MKKIEIAPSLLAADFYSLKDSLKPFNDAQIKYLHFDVMDGNFVENISFGPLVLKSIKNHFDFIMDVHLMINNPLKYYQEFINAGAGIITFHYETLKDDNERLNLIKEVQKQNVLVGISIKPQTDINLLKPLLSDIDLVLVMSVEPGFGGQKFLESALDKVKTLARIKKELNLHFLIEVDGGINNTNAASLIKAGADILVSGSYLFKAPDLLKALASLSGGTL